MGSVKHGSGPGGAVQSVLGSAQDSTLTQSQACFEFSVDPSLSQEVG